MKRTKYLELIQLFKNQRKNQWILLVLNIVSMSLELLFAYQIQILVDDIIGSKPYAEILNLFLKILLLGFTTFLVDTIQNRKWHLFRYKVINQMREMMFARMLQKPMVFFDKRTSGNIVSAIMSDGSLIAENAGIGSLMLILNVIRIISILVILSAKNFFLGMIAGVVCLFYFLSVNLVNKQMREAYKGFSTEVANLNQTFVEDVKAICEIKSLNEKPYFSDRLHDRLWNGYFGKAKQVVTIQVVSGAVNSFINLLFPMFILVLGAFFSYRGYLTVGTIILFYTYIQKLVEPLNNLADFYQSTQTAIGAADRIYEYLFDNDSQEKLSQVELENEIRLDLEIEEFHWEENRTILKDIHQSFVNGDKIYINGESGKGKSTLLKLLCGFYKVSSGAIRINGVSVDEICEQQIFDWIKVQFQEPIILEGTIRENIALGQTFEEPEIFEALKLADLDNFVKEKGLDYQIFENGKNLSGGQKQRLALARVLLRKPKILILDEATSAINEESEKRIVANLNDYVNREKCILIVTSHKHLLRNICNKEIQL